jgi:hypothetical protein
LSQMAALPNAIVAPAMKIASSDELSMSTPGA